MLGEAYLEVMERIVSHLVRVLLSTLSFAKAVPNYPLISLALTWHLIVKCFQFSEKLSSDIGYDHYHPIVHRV